jgi:hypothetical protein
MNIVPAVGVGAGDLLHATRAEVDRIVARTKGDVLAQAIALLDLLRARELINDDEVRVLTLLARTDAQAGTGEMTAQDAYFHSRELYNTMLADPVSSNVALVIASCAVGSYTLTAAPDGGGTVVFAKSNGHWANRGTLTGAVIGSIWGPLGAAVGGAVGGAVGDVVDHCTKD